MDDSTKQTSSGLRRRRAVLVIALAVGGTAAVLPGLGLGAPTGSRAATVVLGAGAMPAPSCPATPCLSIGSVTGFQARTPAANLPFRVPTRGEITAWTISLALPSNKQRHFFNGFFGPPPEARIAVLKRIPRTHPPRYGLRSQSPIRVLTPYLGQRVRFGLARPLPVQPGNIVALTVPTWAPAFGVSLSGKNIWRASRHRGRCRSAADLKRSRPHQVLGSRRAYACRYRGYRLLYTATLAPQRQPAAASADS